jgi:hypothetical protein
VCRLDGRLVIVHLSDTAPRRAVIPAKAGIHVALMQKAKMDSRFRGNDGKKH